jgi:hypothetical protein
MIEKNMKVLPKILVWTTFILFIPDVLLNILNLLNSYFLNEHFGKWLPFSASLLNKLLGFWFAFTILYFILEDRNERKGGKEDTDQ